MSVTAVLAPVEAMASSMTSSSMFLNKPTLPQQSVQSSTLQSLRSLYQRAARSFLQRDVLETQFLIDSAFDILRPPTLSPPDSLASQRKKWDLLRITLETTVYTSPALIKDGSTSSDSRHTSSPSNRQNTLRSNLLLSPPSLLTTLHSRSLRLFTPPSRDPSSAYLPAQILVSLVLASLKLGSPEVGRGMVEDWLTRRSSQDLSDGPGVSHKEEQDGYAKVVEVYCLHVLSQLGDWDYATDFLYYETELPTEKKQHIQSVLRSLHEKALLTPPLTSSSSPVDTNSSLADSASEAPTSRPLSRVSSASSLSSHTAVPATPRPNQKARDPLKNSDVASRLKPTSRSRSRSRSIATVKPTKSKSTRPKTSTNLHHAVTAASSSSSSSPPTSTAQLHPPPTTATPSHSMSLIAVRRRIYSSLTSLKLFIPQLRSHLPFLICVLLPVLALFVKVKAMATSRPRTIRKSGAEEARRRLGMINAGIWVSAWRSVADAVTMAGRGLV